MKIRLLILTISILSMILILFGCSSVTSSNDESKEETIELSVAHALPSTHPIETEVIQPWAEKIEEETDGVVKIKSYPADTLLAADQIYDGVVNGVADMGLSFFSYSAGRFPLMSTLELPGITLENSKVGTEVAMEVLN